MEYKKLKYVNVLAIIGIVFFIAVGIVTFVKPDYLRNNIFEILLLLQIILGAVIITSSLLVTKYASQLFIGLMLSGWGLLIFLINSILPYTVVQWWPVFGTLASIFLFIAGYYRYRKMLVGYVFPSIAVFSFSIWYSLFSFKIVKMSFSKVVLISSPSILITVALFLILYYFAQKKNKKLILKEEDAFSEDEFIDCYNEYKEDSEF